MVPLFGYLFIKYFDSKVFALIKQGQFAEIGIITTRSTIYYKNLVLAILKLKIYQIEIEHKDFKENKTVNVISFYTLHETDSLYLKEMGDNVYYAKKASNG